MTVEMQPIPAAVLDEAETILEDEWMRLTQDWDQWERELAGLPAEPPAPQSRPPRGCTTAVDRRPTAPSPRRRSAITTPPRRSAAPMVWPTQRSPPAATPRPTIQRHSRAKEVMH
jgi:hypothetical protein